jgi:hypothetical protein
MNSGSWSIKIFKKLLLESLYFQDYPIRRLRPIPDVYNYWKRGGEKQIQ